MDKFDIELKRALEIAYGEKWDTFELETASYPNYIFPKEYNQTVLNKCFKVLDSLCVSNAVTDSSVTGVDRRPHFRRVLLVVVLVAVMIIGAVTTYALTHPEIIYNIKNSVIEWEFHFQQTDPDISSEKFVPLKPQLPEGFNVCEETITEHSYTARYEDGNGKSIYYDQNEVDNLGLNIDGEADINEIEINGCKGFSYGKYDDWIVIWDNGYYMFELAGNVEYDMLTRMAESIEQK